MRIHQHWCSTVETAQAVWQENGQIASSARRKRNQSDQRNKEMKTNYIILWIGVSFWKGCSCSLAKDVSFLPKVRRSIGHNGRHLWRVSNCSLCEENNQSTTDWKAISTFAFMSCYVTSLPHSVIAPQALASDLPEWRMTLPIFPGVGTASIPMQWLRRSRIIR